MTEQIVQVGMFAALILLVPYVVYTFVIVVGIPLAIIWAIAIECVIAIKKWRNKHAV